MSRTPKTYPLLASDVARAWVCIGLFVPILAVALIGSLALDVPDEHVGSLTYHIAWSGFSIVYIVLALLVFARPDAETLAGWLRATPRPATRWQRITWAMNGYGAIWWAVSGGAVSVVAMATLISAGDRPPVSILWSGVAVLAASWALIAVSFAVHYAREYAISGGLDFPGDEPPRFADFLYFALQLTTTYAGSDVAITTTRMRRSAALHGVIAFLFNTVIIAILVAVLLAVVS